MHNQQHQESYPGFRRGGCSTEYMKRYYITTTNLPDPQIFECITTYRPFTHRVERQQPLERLCRDVRKTNQGLDRRKGNGLREQPPPIKGSAIVTRKQQEPPTRGSKVVEGASIDLTSRGAHAPREAHATSFQQEFEWLKEGS